MAGNIVLPNLKSTFANTDAFFGVWNLTRAMKAAGWIYKASGDGTNKETTANPLLDKWGPGSIVQSVQLSSQTGAAATISSISVTSVTITGLTGMTAQSAGHYLQMSGAVNSGNNGTFAILTFISASSVTIWNPGAVSEATALTWSERVSGTGASISAPTGDEATVSGLSGISATTSPGHMLTITNATNSANNNGTFRISAVLSASSVKIKNANSIAESGTLTWVEVNPAVDIYPYNQLQGTAGWINMQGPSTMKIPISNSSTGTLVRGENVTQSSSGAQGELVGYLWDQPTVQGYLVIVPRINGTGGGPRGWTTGTADTITGGISGATVPTFSTPIEYVREFVFWKNTNITQGFIAYQCVDQNVATEGTNRFSYLAVNAAGVTASVAPSGGGTGNTFPTVGTFICIGSTPSSGTDWDMNSGVPATYGHIQTAAVNAASTSGVSGDGSFFMAVGRPDVNSNVFTGFIFSRCDNSEDGDVDPYAWYAGNGGGNYSGSRTSCTAGSNADMWSYLGASQNATMARGWRRRGFASGDAFQQFAVAGVVGQSQSGNNSYFAFNLNSGDVDSVACSFSTTKVREPVFVISTQTSFKMRKGTMRWMYAVAGGGAADTLDNRKWIQVSTNSNGGNGSGPFVIGPWDGLTIPIQS